MLRDFVNFNLQDAMRSLYTTMGYYVSIAPGEQKGYEEEYWHHIVDPDGRQRNRLTERDLFVSDIKSEINFINKLEPGKILDIGCGLGWVLSAVGDGWEKYGIEVSLFASKRAIEYGDIFVGTVLDYPSEANYFDLIIMHHVIEHMNDPVENLIRIKKLLKSGGVLIIGTPDFDSGCARRYGTNYRLLHDKSHISLFSNDSMHRLLRDHGFVISKVEYPYFDTRYFTHESLNRMLKIEGVSPPFYGNFMTFYAVNN